jgi:hypothetical protein
MGASQEFGKIASGIHPEVKLIPSFPGELTAAGDLPRYPNMRTDSRPMACGEFYFIHGRGLGGE